MKNIMLALILSLATAAPACTPAAEPTPDPGFSLYRYLDTACDGTGERNAIGDYSEAPQIFCISPPANTTYSLARVIIRIESLGPLDAGRYGSIVLQNGVTLRVTELDATGSRETVIDFTDGSPILYNAHWGNVAYDVGVQSFGPSGVGSDSVVIRFSFFKSGRNVYLRPGQRLEFVLNDDFSSLLGHYVHAQGYIISAPPPAS